MLKFYYLQHLCIHMISVTKGFWWANQCQPLLLRCDTQWWYQNGGCHGDITMGYLVTMELPPVYRWCGVWQSFENYKFVSDSWHYVKTPGWHKHDEWLSHQWLITQACPFQLVALCLIITDRYCSQFQRICSLNFTVLVVLSKSNNTYLIDNSDPW